MAAWRDQALSRLRPSPEEQAEVHEDVEALLERIGAFLDEQGWEGTPRIEGSVAKGTYLHGEADADVFIQFPTSVERDELVERVHRMKPLLEDAVVAYAEHPYVQGTFRGHDAEIVPCYELQDPTELRSAVDRTPFHTEHVKAHLDEGLRDEVRLLKAFLKAVGCYGAEEAVRGVSGYLAELLVLARGSFDEVLAWAVDRFPHPVTFDEPPQESFEDPLVVVDPVDPSRNAAAAVAPSALVRFREAAAAFRARPSADAFAELPAPEMAPGDALACCEARRSRVLAVSIPIEDQELADPVHAQLRRAVTLAAEELEREQVPVLATATHLEADRRPEHGWVLAEAYAPALDEPYLHEGPPAAAEEHADSFRDRWEQDPAAAGEVFEEDGRLFVEVEREHGTLAGIVQPLLREANAGKVLDEALAEGSARFLEGKDAIAELPADVRARILDRRRPWERG